MKARQLRKLALLAVMLIALPLTAARAGCLWPTGNTGEMLYNNYERQMQYCNGSGWIAMGTAAPFNPIGYFFVDTARIARGGNLTGVSASKLATGSLWFRRMGNFGTAQYLYSHYTGSAARFAVYFDTSNKLRIEGGSSSATNRLQWISTPAYTDTNWHHLMFSFDVTSNANTKVYVDGSSVSAGTNTASNGTITFNAGDVFIGALNGTPTSPYTGDIAELWMMFGTRIDPGTGGNLAKFYSSGKPVYLGPNGALPNGSQPAVYMTDDGNLGSGGEFNYDNGPIPIDNVPGPGFPCPTKGQLYQAAFQSKPSGWAYVGGMPGYVFYSNGTVEGYTWNGTTLTYKTVTGSIGSQNLWSDGTYLYTSYVSGGVGGIQALTFNGTSFTTAGSLTLSGNGSGTMSVTGDKRYIYMADETVHKLYAFSFNGSSFTKLAEVTMPGTGGTLNYRGIWSDNTYIYVPYNNGGLLAYGFNGSTLTLLDTFVPDEGYAISVTGDGKYVYLWGSDNAHTASLYALTFDGSAFTYLDNDSIDPYGISWPSDTGITYMNGAIFAAIYDGPKVVVNFNGIDFDIIGFWPPGGPNSNVATDGTYFFAEDYNNGLRIFGDYSACTATCSLPTGTAGNLMYNQDYHVMQFCDGQNWRKMGHSPGTGGAGCNNPPGAGGDMLYNEDHHVMQYCDGAKWVAVGHIPGAEPVNGLGVQWLLHDGSGTTPDDNIGSNDGTLSGGTAWTAGKSGVANTALSFDGSNDYMYVTDNAVQRPAALTVSLWVNPTDTLGATTTCGGNSAYNTAYVLNKSDANTSFFEGYAFRLFPGGGIQFILSDGSGVETPGTDGVWADYLPPGQWTHLVATFSRPALKMYMNGALVDQSTHDFNLSLDNTKPLFIGRSGHCGDPGYGTWDGYFKGKIEDIRIYNRALSATEVSDLYFATKP